MRKKTKEQRDSAVGEWVNMVIASFHHKAIPPKIIFNKILIEVAVFKSTILLSDYCKIGKEKSPKCEEISELFMLG